MRVNIKHSPPREMFSKTEAICLNLEAIIRKSHLWLLMSDVEQRNPVSQKYEPPVPHYRSKSWRGDEICCLLGSQHPVRENSSEILKLFSFIFLGGGCVIWISVSMSSSGSFTKHAGKHLLTDETLDEAPPYCLCLRTASLGKFHRI